MENGKHMTGVMGRNYYCYGVTGTHNRISGVIGKFYFITGSHHMLNSVIHKLYFVLYSHK